MLDFLIDKRFVTFGRSVFNKQSALYLEPNLSEFIQELQREKEKSKHILLIQKMVFFT